MSAATSLSLQLAAIAGEEKRGRGKPSLLFTAAEADAYDVNAIYNIGLNGLSELCLLDSRFNAFQADLFSEGWKDIDRETRDTDTNTAISLRITAFCRLLQPYFVNRAAIKALEYVIRRFKATTYNVDALIEAAFPHMDSVLAGRLLSLLDLSSPLYARATTCSYAPLFAFAKDAQKASAPLPRSLLALQCGKDVAFVKFLGDMAATCISEHVDGKMDATPLLRMVTSVLLEFLTRLPTIQEKLLSSLMPVVLRGLKALTFPEAQQMAHVLVLALSKHCAFAKASFDGLVGVAIGRAPQDPAACVELLRFLVGLFGSQAEHQGVRPTVSAPPEEEERGGGGEGTSGYRTWLSTYQFDKDTITKLLAIDNLHGLLARLADSTDIRVFLRVACISGLTAVVECHKSSDDATIALVRNALVAIVKAVPASALSSNVAAIVRYCVSRYRAIDRLSLVITTSTSAAAALADVLRAFTAGYVEEVDAGLQFVLQPSTRQRRRSRGNSLSQIGDLHAHGSAPHDDKVIGWVTNTLFGTRLASVSATSTSGTPDMSPDAVNLTMALAHASPVVRLRGFAMLRGLADTFATNMNAGDDEGAPEVDTAMLFRTLVSGVVTGLQDEDAGVARAALHLVHLLLATNAPPVLLDTADVETLGAYAASDDLKMYLRHAVCCQSLLRLALGWQDQIAVLRNSTGATTDAATPLEMSVQLNAASAQRVISDALYIVCVQLLPRLQASMKAAPPEQQEHVRGLPQALEALTLETASILLSWLPLGCEPFTRQSFDDSLLSSPLAATFPMGALAVDLCSRAGSWGTPVEMAMFQHVSVPDMCPSMCVATGMLKSASAADTTVLAALTSLLQRTSQANTLARTHVFVLTVLDAALHLLLQGCSGPVEEKSVALTHAGIVAAADTGKKGKSASASVHVPKAQLMEVLSGLTCVVLAAFRDEMHAMREQSAQLVLQRRTQLLEKQNSKSTSSMHISKDLAGVRGCHSSQLPPAAVSGVGQGGKDPFRHLWRYSLSACWSTDAVPADFHAADVARYNVLRARLSMASSGLDRCLDAMLLLLRHAGADLPLAHRWQAVFNPAHPALTLVSAYEVGSGALREGSVTTLLVSTVAKLFVLLASTPDESVAFESFHTHLRKIFEFLEGVGKEDVSAVPRFLGAISASADVFTPLTCIRAFQTLRTYVAHKVSSAPNASKLELLQATIPYLLLGAVADAASTAVSTAVMACSALPWQMIRQCAWAVLRDVFVGLNAAGPSRALMKPLSHILSASSNDAAAELDLCVKDPSHFASTVAAQSFESMSLDLLRTLLRWSLSASVVTQFPHLADACMRLVTEVTNVAARQHSTQAAALAFTHSILPDLLGFLNRFVEASADTTHVQPVGTVSTFRQCLIVLSIHYDLISNAVRHSEAFMSVDKDAIIKALPSTFQTLGALFALPVTVSCVDTLDAIAHRSKVVPLEVVRWVVEVVTPDVFWLAQGTGSLGKTSFARQLLHHVFLTTPRASALATQVRHLLGRLRLDAALFCGLVEDESLAYPPSTGSRTASDITAGFKYSAAATAFAKRVFADKDTLMTWFSKSTVFMEVLLANLQSTAEAAKAEESRDAKESRAYIGPFKDGQQLVPHLFAILETLLAVAEAVSTHHAADALDQAGKSNEQQWQVSDLVSSFEYLQRLTCDCLLQLASHYVAVAKPLPNAARLFNAEVIISVVQTTTSTQTRSVALLLLGKLAALVPKEVLSRLLPVLFDIDSTTLIRDDSYSLSIVKRLVEEVVPPLLTHGKAVGVSVFGLFKVFTAKLKSIPQHRHKVLFGALLDAASSSATHGSAFVPAMLALLCQQHAKEGGLSRGLNEAALELCTSLLGRFHVTDQVRALSSCALVVSNLLSSVVGTGDIEEEEEEEEEEEGGDGQRGHTSLSMAELLPVLMSDSGLSTGASDGDALPVSVLFRVASMLLGVLESHLGSDAFRSTAKAAGPPSAPAQKDLQVRFLALTEKLISVTEIAAEQQEARLDLSASVSSGEKHKSGHKRKTGEADAHKPAPVDAARNIKHKFWSSVLDACFSILKTLTAHMSTPALTSAIETLLQHENAGVQVRALAFFDAYLESRFGKGKLSTAAELNRTDAAVYMGLVENMQDILVSSLHLNDNPSLATVIPLLKASEQTIGVYINALAVLGSYFAPSHGGNFVGPMTTLTNVLVLVTSAPAPLAAEGKKAKAAVVFNPEDFPVFSCALASCLGLLATHLGPAVIPLVPKLVPAVIHLLHLGLVASQAQRASAAEVVCASLQSLKMMIIALPLFIHPYLRDLFACVLHPCIVSIRSSDAPTHLAYFDRRIIPDIAAAASTDGAPPASKQGVFFMGVDVSGLNGRESRSKVALVSEEHALAEMHVGKPTSKFVLEHPAVPVTSTADALAADIVKIVLRSVPLRSLIGPLLGSFPLVTRQGGVFGAVHHVRAVHALVTACARRDVRENASTLFSFVVDVMDYRWRSTPADQLQLALGTPSDATTGASTALAIQACGSSVVELETAALVVSIVLKLNEAHLKPFLIRLIQWMNISAEDLRSELEMSGSHSAAEISWQVASDLAGGAAGALPSPLLDYAQLCRRITGYRVLQYITASLRSLFLPSISYFLPEIAKELTSLSAGKEATTSYLTPFAPLDGLLAPAVVHDAEGFADATYVPGSPHGLRCMLLACLYHAFVNDTLPDPDGFMSAPKLAKQRLDVILKPLVAQIDLPTLTPVGHNDASVVPAKKKSRKETASHAEESGVISRLGVPQGKSGYQTYIRTYLVAVVGVLVAALRKDTLWKPVNTSLLMLTRHDTSRVRLAALQCVTELFNRSGDEGIVLVPETLPFLSEVLSGEDSAEVAAATQLLQALEEKSGEDLQRYLA